MNVSSKSVFLLLTCVVFGFTLLLYTRKEIQTSDSYQYNVSDIMSPLTTMTDKNLIHYLSKKILRPIDFNLNTYPVNQHWSQMGESQMVDEMLKKRTDGFFVECGASDGITYSNSLFFEATRNWTGLLIEANGGFFKELLKRKRNSYAYHGCLSPNNYPQILTFQESNFLGGLASLYEKNRKKVMDGTPGTKVQVECVPLYSLLLALNVTHIDYFSLDTEGSELAILKTIPFDKIKIDIISVEWIIWHGGKEAEEQKIKDLMEVMRKTNLYEEGIKHSVDLYFKRKN